MRIVIAGGVAGGASAAVKARRENEHCEIIMLEKGPYVSFANCGLPYYISREIQQLDDLLVVMPEDFRDKFNIDVRLYSELIGVDSESHTIQVRTEQGQYELHYDRLILSQGAEPLQPPLPGLDRGHVFSLRTIEDMKKIDQALVASSVESAVVVGGGFIGLEMAEALHTRGVVVTVVERMQHVMPLLDQGIGLEFQRRLVAQGIDVLSSTSVKEVLNRSVLIDGGREIQADLVVVAAGVRPEVEIARKAGLKIGETHGVWVNEYMQTSEPDIYAVGDMVQTRHRVSLEPSRIPLAGPANRQGRIAGANAASGRRLKYKGALGTSVVRCLGEVVGSTGLNEAAARKAGFQVGISETINHQHAGYYPGAESLLIRLLWDLHSGRILGAQVLGRDGVDKRVDVFATAIAGGMTIEDLQDLDLAYAPPFGSANDPVNMAGFTASNLASGVFNGLEPEDIDSEDLLLDVRTQSELENQGRVAGAVHIPLMSLRERYQELDSSRRIVTLCYKGQRGYLAERILSQRGFQARGLKGGTCRLSREHHSLQPK